MKFDGFYLFHVQWSVFQKHAIRSRQRERVATNGASRGEISSGHDVETQTELILGAFYSLMFSWTHLEDYPMRERARAMAELLGDSLATAPTSQSKESTHGPS